MQQQQSVDDLQAVRESEREGRETYIDMALPLLGTYIFPTRHVASSAKMFLAKQKNWSPMASGDR